MKNKKNRCLSYVLAAALVLLCTGGMQFCVNAEPSENEIELRTGAVLPEKEVLIKGSGEETPEELFEEYIESVLYEGIKNPAAEASIGSERIETKEEKAFYDEMMVKIKEIAAGKTSNTKIKLNMKMVWTAQELGVDKITSANADYIAGVKLSAVFDFGRVISYLLMDCPYELYWYDKTEYSNLYYSYSYNSKSITIQSFEVHFPVVPEYQGSGQYSLNTSAIKTVEKSRDRSKSIVEETKNLSNYERLKAFKDIICDLTDYNDDAVENEYTPYGNPWQMIWVFDDNPSTKVVCEGYSKAFQYLCDLAGFTCYTVTGDMASGGGGGPHMWNVVKFAGKNYLVDVTNCDDGSIGYPNGLFLAGTSVGSVRNGYEFLLSRTVSFVYSDDQEELFGWSKLNLAPQSFDPDTLAPLEVTFPDTSLTLPYKKIDPKIPVPKVTKYTNPVTDAKLTYMHRAYGSYGSYKEGLPKGIGTFEVKAVANGDLYHRSESRNTLILTLEDSVANVFTDIQGYEWYFDYVQAVYDKELMTGISGTLDFQPESNITKAQVAQVLFNMEGQPWITSTSVFEDLVDVYSVEWYAQAVAWAYNEGIITGDLYTLKFSPNAPVTREQLALMMYRYAAYKGYDTTQSSTLEGLKNDWKVNTYALDAVKWAVGSSLISGIEVKNSAGVVTARDLAPQGNSTRAQMATILTRFCSNFE